jgi:hypothetical protein
MRKGRELNWRKGVEAGWEPLRDLNLKCSNRVWLKHRAWKSVMGQRGYKSCEEIDSDN